MAILMKELAWEGGKEGGRLMTRCLVIRIVVTAIVLKRRRCTLRQYDIHIIECTAEEQPDSAVILNKCDSQLLFYPVLVAPDEKTGSWRGGYPEAIF